MLTQRVNIGKCFLLIKGREYFKADNLLSQTITSLTKSFNQLTLETESFSKDALYLRLVFLKLFKQ